MSDASSVFEVSSARKIIFVPALRPMLAASENEKRGTIFAPVSFSNEHRPERAKMLVSVIRNRQETMNKRFKHFGCMKQVFRHGIEKHAICFRAIAVIVQLSLELNQPLFEIDDYVTTNL